MYKRQVSNPVISKVREGIALARTHKVDAILSVGGGSVLDSVKASASVGLVIGGALILNYIVASENIPKLLADAMLGMQMSPMAFMLGVNLLLLLLGCILDASTIILVIVPLFVVAARALGIDPKKALDE